MSERVVCAKILHLTPYSPRSRVLLIPWLAPGLMSSYGKPSQELLSIHDARHRDSSPNR